MQYNDYMNMLGASNTAKWKVFSITLKASDKDWYFSLPQGSVYNFSQLGKMLLGRFRAHRVIMNKPMGLMLVKKREGEFLQDCVERFHAAILNTKNLEDQWMIYSFIMGVKNDHVQYSFTNNRPKSLAALYVQDHKFTEAKEIKRASLANFKMKDRQPRNRKGQCARQSPINQSLRVMIDRSHRTLAQGDILRNPQSP